MRPLVRGIALTMLIVVLAAAAAGGALAWRLSQGRVSLAPIAGLLGDLVARGTPYAVQFADPGLEWSSEQAAVYITARDIEVRTSGGGFIASAPSAGVRIDAAALLWDRAIVVRDVELRLPAMQLDRAADGQLSLAFDGRLAALPLADATGPGLLAQLGRGNDEAADGRLQLLRRIRVSAASLHYRDLRTGRTVETGAARLRLTREDAAGWEMTLSVIPGAPGSVIRVTASPADGADRRAVSVTLAGAPVSMARALLPDVSFEGTELSIDAEGSFLVDLPRRSVVSGQFRANGRPGTVALPGILAAPIRLGVVQVRGEMNAATGIISVDPFDAPINGTQVTVTPSIGDDSVSGLLTTSGIERDAVLALWPLTAGPKARAWVAGNVASGVVTSFRIDRRQDGELALDGTLRDVELKVLPAWPQATGVAGRLRFADRRLDVTLEKGSLSRTELRRGTLSLIDDPNGSTGLAADVSIAGEVRSLLDVLARPPLRVDPGIRPDQTEGSITADIRLDLPTLRDVPRDRVRFDVAADLKGLAIRNAVAGHDLTSGELHLDVTQEAARARGKVVLEDVPLEIGWTERLRGAGERRRIDVSGSIGPDDLRRLGLGWDGFRGGSARLEATLTRPRSGPQRVDLHADLLDADLQLARLGLAKARGAPGSARASVVDDRPRRLAIEKIDIDLKAAAARGSLDLDPAGGGWKAVTIERLSWPRGALSAALARRDGAIVGTIDAGRLDLRDLPAAEADGKGSGSPALDLRLRIDELLLGSRPFTAVTASVVRDPKRLRSLLADARLPGGATANVRLGPPEAPDRLAAEAQDFGALLAALGLGDRVVDGGRVKVDGTVGDDGTGGAVVEGELKAREFIVRDAPTIAGILSLASFQGISNTLGGRGLQIDRLTAPFRYLNDRIELRQARVVGSQIGGRVDGRIDLAGRTLALQGTIAPLYTLNRIIGRIPLIGDLLRGDRADAALAATFSVNGSLDAPQISVNPLAAIVPGVIRDLFADDTAPPAPPPG